MNKKLIEEVISDLPNCLSIHDTYKLVDKLKQAIAHEHRFYFNQPVLVRDGNLEPRPALFKGRHNTSDIYPFSAHANGHNAPCGWRYCKPDPDAVSLPNWLPVTGKLEALTDGYIHMSKDNTMYCIIHDPEYLEVSDE